MSIIGETLLSCTLTEIFNKISSVVTGGITGAWKLEADLEKLRVSIGRIQGAQVTANDEYFWELQEVIYSAEDVLDEFHYETLRRQVENLLKHKAREFVFRASMATRVKKVNVKVPELASLGAASSGVVLVSPTERMTHSYLENKPSGRTDELESIMKVLKVSSSARLTVVSIVGFGGLGKTFLGKLVKEEAEKNKLFDEFMWVCVSETFDDSKILREMLQKLDGAGGIQSSLDATIHHLQLKLKDKSFFLVLDDVWNENFEKWDSLKVCLENVCGKSGNFVITTTRSSNVAKIMGSSHVEELKELSDTECWSIIKERIARNEGKSNISSAMENIGKEIAKKCRGVPLAAKVVGSLMSSRMNLDEWSSLQRSNVWNEIDEDKRIMGVLKLSFDHLPPPQKLCFVYCSIFPKNFVFEKTQLVQLWMAEGFLNMVSKNGEKSDKLMEDVGEEYFHSLLVNSFFQDVHANDFGNIVRCKMHDLLHDLASSISKSQRLQYRSDCIETDGGHRMCFLCDQVSKVKEILKESKEKTRTLRCLFCRVDVSPMLSCFRRLRSLDMSSAKLKDLPHGIRKLKHLRYLDISNNETIQVLPNSFTKLYNLQTLRVFECKSLKGLPNKMRNLVSLRHLGIDDKRLMPLKVGHLTNLQTLPFFVVGAKKGQKIDELEGLKELRGEVVICGLENVRDKEEAERARIKEKKLCKLVLQWMKVEENEVEKYSSMEESKHEEVMRGLEAPKNIQTLTVEWFLGKQFPECMFQLNKLVMLTLKDCRRCERMPTLGHLPNLKILIVERMNNMKFMGVEFYGDTNNEDTLFPAIEELYIREMKSLVGWMIPRTSDIFPKLQKLEIIACPNLTSSPLSQSTSTERDTGSKDCSWEILRCLDLKSLESLYIRDCPKLKLSGTGLTSVSHGVYYSKPFGGQWRVVKLNESAKIIEEFPKSLEDLEIDGFDSELSVEAFNGLSCLKHLVLRNYHKPIPNLSPLTSLESLQLSNCLRQHSIPTLSSLTSLKKFKLRDCDDLQLIPPLSSLSSLEHLEILSCSRIESIPTLSSRTCLKHLVISCVRLESIPPLSSLSCLEHLEISSCYRIESIPTLGHLPNLKLLIVEKMDSVKYMGGEFYGESNNEGTLFPSLQELYIRAMKSLVEWMAPKTSEIFPKLHKLEIRDCPKLTSFPLSQSTSTARVIRLNYTSWDILCSLDFKSLEQLWIRDCPKLTFFHIGLKSLSRFSLCDKDDSKELGGSWRWMVLYGPAKIVEEFPKCVELVSVHSFHSELSAEAFQGLSCLKHLSFTSYNTPIPNLSSLTSLLSLEFKSLVQHSIPTLSSLTSLKKLILYNFPHLESIPPLIYLTSLEHLEISCCSKIVSIPTLSSLTCLKELKVQFCGRVSIDDDIMGSLTQLKELIWGGFSEELDHVPGLNSIHLLTSLQNVELIGWFMVKSLPHQLQHLTSITKLELYSFIMVESLPDWLCNLKSLQTLCIRRCWLLESLPKDMQRLSELTTLEISGCQLLSDRCRKNTGPEWCNISHIPHIIINFQVIQDLRCG